MSYSYFMSIKKCDWWMSSCVDNKNECPNYVYALLIQLDAVLDCRKILLEYSSLIHCHVNFIILCNDGSCCSIKILWQKTTDEIICPDKSMTRPPDDIWLIRNICIKLSQHAQ